MAAGKAPSVLAPFLAGAPLTALHKKQGGVRPIAVGEVFRRLVSKCCCTALMEQMRTHLSPTQVGVATKGGAEAVTHAVRRLASDFGHLPSKVVLKVDNQNAFNCIHRDKFLLAVYQHFPDIYSWVAYCYAEPIYLPFLW